MGKDKYGFTLIELLVVIAIIGLLSTLSILGLNQARAASRDTKRIADVKQIQTALELYYNAEGDYPTEITPGNPIKDLDDNVYIAAVPKPPTPTDGANCPDVQPEYTYTYIDVSGAGGEYTIEYCLGSDVSIVEGDKLQTATPAGIMLQSTETEEPVDDSPMVSPAFYGEVIADFS